MNLLTVPKPKRAEPSTLASPSKLTFKARRSVVFLPPRRAESIASGRKRNFEILRPLTSSINNGTQNPSCYLLILPSSSLPAFCESTEERPSLFVFKALNTRPANRDGVSGLHLVSTATYYKYTKHLARRAAKSRPFTSGNESHHFFELSVLMSIN